MYNVSSDFLEKINSVSREVYWYGSIHLKNGTNYQFDVTNLKQGQTSITRQLCASQKIEIGCTCSSELKIAFMLDYDPDTNKYTMNGIEVDRYQFYDAEIQLIFRLYFNDEKTRYEDVHLGTYIVSSPERTQSVLTCTAYDYMQKFSKACVSQIQGTPYGVLLTACGACGVQLGSTPEEIYKMVNARATCAMYDPQNSIKTWRDVIGYVCSMICANAIIKADNKLYIIPYSGNPIRTISADNRVNLTLEDYITNYRVLTSVNLRTNTEERIKSDVEDGLTYALGGNPLIQYVLASTRLQVLAEIYAALHNLDYVPFTGTFFTDPSFELGDVVEFTDNHAGNSTKSVITQIEISIGNHMSMSCSGDNPYGQKAEIASDAEYASSTSGSVGDGVQFYDYQSDDDISVTNEAVELLAINYESNGAYRQEFEAEVKLTVATGETLASNVYTENDSVVTVTYFINGQQQSYQPQYTYTDGVYLLHLFYVWTSNIRVNVSTFSANIQVGSGSLTITDVRARIMQAGEAYVAPSNELEYIEVVNRPAKTLYRIGDTLDYTSLMVMAVYEDGHKDDITNVCTYTPANGSLVLNPKDIIVNVDYVKDEVPYHTEFDLEVKYLESIYVDKEPTKTEYFVGENVNYSGVKIVADFSDGTHTTVTSNCRFTPMNGSTLNNPGIEHVQVDYTYDSVSRSTSFTLNVSAIKIDSFEITPPSKLTYDEGEALDYTGLVATAIYNNGDTKNVTNDCTFEPLEGSAADPEKTLVKVFYSEDGRSFTGSFDIEVIEAPVFEGITVTPPTYTSYWLGDETDYTGVVVTGEFSDGTTIDVTSESTFDPANGTTTTMDMSVVNVYYTRNGSTYTDSFSIEVKEPEPILKYLNYTIDTGNRKIFVTGLNAEEIANDKLRNLEIPATYTDPDSGITFTMVLSGN